MNAAHVQRASNTHITKDGAVSERGAAEGIRTPDPRITNAVLYRLSYRGKPLIDQLTCRSGNQQERFATRQPPNGIGRALL